MVKYDILVLILVLSCTCMRAAMPLKPNNKNKIWSTCMEWYWYIVLCVIVLAVCYILFNFLKVKRMKEGTEEMAEMAGIIRSGATTFLKTEYKTIFWVVAAVALIFTLFVEKTSGITFLMEIGRAHV